LMGTLKGFPNPPALWLRRAKPAYANANNPGNSGWFHLEGMAKTLAATAGNCLGTSWVTLAVAEATPAPLLLRIVACRQFHACGQELSALVSWTVERNPAAPSTARRRRLRRSGRGGAHVEVHVRFFDLHASEYPLGL
jgi:hypothetical protein